MSRPLEPSSSTVPHLSVVVPSHDTWELTASCVESLERHGVPGMEILVVDDGSRDGTVEKLRERFPAVRVLERDRAGGFTTAANQGLAAARGEILLLLNSDTEMEAGSLTAVLHAFEAQPDLGVAGGRLTYPGGAPQWSGGREPSFLWLLGLASGLPALLGRIPAYRSVRRPSGFDGAAVDWVTGAALALRRPVWDEVGALDERFAFYAQDLDFCLRARDAGWQVAVVPGFRVVHHHGSTISAREEAEALRFHPRMLWADLIRWAGKTGGERGARRAARALAIGTRLRLVGLRLARLLPLGGGAVRRRREREARALVPALEVARRCLHEGPPPPGAIDAVGESLGGSVSGSQSELAREPGSEARP